MDAGTLAALGGILLLLILSAVFSGTETAFTAASRAFVTRRAREGDRRAGLLVRLRERKDRLIAAILVGNNLVNTTATALASGLLIAWFGEGGVVYASLVMTALLVVFAEVLPKTYALRQPDRTALRAVPLLSATMRLLGPLAAAVNWLVLRTLGLFGVRAAEAERPGITEDELLGAIELHGAGERGEAEAAAREERRMLRGVLALDDLTVGDVMTHRARIRALDAEAPPEVQLERLLASPHARLPLWCRGGEEVLGIVDARAALQALRAVGGEAARLDLRPFAAPAVFVPEGRPLREQLQEFRRAHLKMALVVDEYGALQGLVTLEDVVEVIVGQIAQRGEPILAEAAGDGVAEVRGDIRVRDLNRELDWDLPEEEAATVGGLVVSRLRAIPPVGTEVTIDGYAIRVVERRGWRLDRLAIRRLAPPEEAG
ncbi:HlyC/CorC family transporter [Crenalkalicoccus roseus]|uniref:HlyC/CorC family transporter n=1 Tax=Crenalkalicoccus roseus TaxID=1485588 RepID=UPI00107FE2F6|nr:CNNM domain-containing protein [Crenalkalicoccus roseus]